MSEKQSSRDTEYRDRRDTEPPKQTGNINSRNNNASDDLPATAEETIERANDAGVSDSGWNDEKLSNFTENHSSDA